MSNLGFSFADVRFYLKLILHLIRTSHLSFNTVKIFNAPNNGNKKRVANILSAVKLDPYFLQHKIHSIEKDYAVVDTGGTKTYIIRDFDLFVKCSTLLGHRGDEVTDFFYQCCKGTAFNSQPSRYGECPYGNWDVYKDIEPHYMASDRHTEQGDMIRNIVEEHFNGYIGKTVEIGELTRLLVWNMLTATSFGVEEMSSAGLPYEWSPEFKDQIRQLQDWGKAVLGERLASIDEHSAQCDVLTDTVLNHGDVDLMKSVGAILTVYSAGMDSFHSPICGTLIFNSLNNDEVYKYYMESPQDKMDNIIRESLRLYSAVPTGRGVREEDDLEIDGKKLETGTAVLLSTYAIGTDPRSWENPMQFDPNRFANTKEIGFLCQRGFIPLGAPANLGGRQCSGRFHISNMMKVMLDKVLRDYRLTAKKGGYFEFRQSDGQSKYAGKCFVTIEKR